MANKLEHVIKYLIVIINIGFGVIGLTIFTLGVYIEMIFNIPGLSLLAIGTYIKILFDDNNLIISIPLIIVGFILILCVIIGCFGVIRENICLLKTAISLLVVMVVAESGIIIGGSVCKNEIFNYVETNMMNVYMLETSDIIFGENPAIFNETIGTGVDSWNKWDWIQETWECCGVRESADEIMENSTVSADEIMENSTVSADDILENRTAVLNHTFSNTTDGIVQIVVAETTETNKLKEGVKLKEENENSTFVEVLPLTRGLNYTIFDDIENLNISCCAENDVNGCQKRLPDCFSVLKQNLLNYAVIAGVISSLALLQILTILLVVCLIKRVSRRKGFGNLQLRSRKRAKQDRPSESWKLAYNDPNLQQYRTSRMYIDPNMAIYADPTETAHSHIVRDRKQISFKAKNIQVTEI